VSAAAPSTEAAPGPRASRSPFVLIGIVVLVLTAAAMLHVWVHLQVIAVGYEISRETRARHDLTEQNQRLMLELRTRLDLAQIERTARDQLKMVAPDPRAIRVLPVPREALP
jgi:cell division protein FtsL